MFIVTYLLVRLMAVTLSNRYRLKKSFNAGNIVLNFQQKSHNISGQQVQHCTNCQATVRPLSFTGSAATEQPRPQFGRLLDMRRRAAATA